MTRIKGKTKVFAIVPKNITSNSKILKDPLKNSPYSHEDITVSADEHQNVRLSSKFLTGALIS